MNGQESFGRVLPCSSNNIKELDDISSSFNNSTTTFNLTIGGVAYQPRNAAMLQISLGGVIQEPTTDYTISTSTITFTTAPNAGLDFFGVVRGTAVAIDYAKDGNVQTKQEFTATEGQTSFTVMVDIPQDISTYSEMVSD